jgi:hypothetical protein
MIGADSDCQVAPRCSDHAVSTTSDADPGTWPPNTYPIPGNSAHQVRIMRPAPGDLLRGQTAPGVVVLTDLPRARAHSGPTGTPRSRRGAALITIRFHRRRDCEHIENPHSLLEMAVWGWDAARCNVCADG